MNRFLSIMLLFLAGNVIAQTNAPKAFEPTPNTHQMKYLHSPMAAFVHFGMNTFAETDGIEWGNDVKRDPSVFNPKNIDTDQWVRLLKKAGFTRVIVTLKHHDGFCLWPTKITDYNISKSPYLNGKGDLGMQLSHSCDKYGMDMGIYLSPWDAWEPCYGDVTPGDYNDFYDGQLRELLGGAYGRLNPKTGKREIVEIWLDGATGSGVAHQTYDFGRYVKTVRELQPKCLTWMTLEAAKNYCGSPANFPVDAFWVGNERGYVNDPVWLKVKVEGDKVKNYQPDGQYMSIPEADVSIRPGWFYHTAQDGSVKSLDQLMNGIYFRTVGMGIPLLLNIPPDRSGKFHPNDSAALMNFGKTIENTFSANLITKSAKATASSARSAQFGASKAIDNQYDTYWTMKDGQKTGSITVDLGKEKDFDIVKIQEYIPLGQRISGFKVEVQSQGKWQEFGSGETVGYQRMVKGKLVKARKIRITVTASLDVPLINNIAVYRYAPTVKETIQQSADDAVLNFTQEKATVSENSKIFTFEVKRAGNIATEAEVTVITVPGTGVHGKTYQDKTIKLLFSPWEISKKASVNIIDNDLNEGDKNFYIELTNPSKGTTLGKQKSLNVLVREND